MSLHLPNGRNVSRFADEPSGTWVDVRHLEDSGVAVKDLGSGRIGLCPSPDRCIPVPETASQGSSVNLAAVADDLGFIIADDGHHAVIRHAPGTSSTAGRALLSIGDEFDLQLPDLDGHDRPVVPRHGQAAVFAWASW